MKSSKKYAPKYYKQDALGFLKIRIDDRERDLKLLKHQAKLNLFMKTKAERDRMKIKILILQEDIRELKRDYAVSTGKTK